jgi:hypothetical protein
MSSIEQYLKEFQKALPHHLRREATTEVHSHLEELAQEWQRRGLPRAEAENRAVRQFGSPNYIGSQWRQAAGVVDWPDILLAALPILGITGLGWYFIGRFIPLSLYLVMFGLGAVVAWQRRWPTWWYAWLGWLFLALVVKEETVWVFFIIFPIVVTLISIDSWQQATLMTLPFTTYLAFMTLMGGQRLVTTGWGPGSIYPGYVVWAETAFSILWIAVLAASLRAARPSRRGVYLLAGLIGTQLIYVGTLTFMIIVAKLMPAYFVTNITTRYFLINKLPLGIVIIGLTLYPLLVWLAARWVRRSKTRPGLPA